MWHKKIQLFIIICFINLAHAADWHLITLPHSYIYPCHKKPCGNIGTNVYSMQFPTTKADWFHEPECGENTYRPTSLRWITDHLQQVKGISFKGLVYKQATSNQSSNEFAVFFHEKRCYDGGPEYGWVFTEDSYKGFFYICGNCNLENQQWCQWPEKEEGKYEGTCKAVSGDIEGVKEALKNPATYRYWNIIVLTNGDFEIALIDPVSWKTVKCVIQKPDWFPNLHNVPGYITITAQKKSDETIKPAPYMHIDEVKIYK